MRFQDLHCIPALILFFFYRHKRHLPSLHGVYSSDPALRSHKLQSHHLPRRQVRTGSRQRGGCPGACSLILPLCGNKSMTNWLCIHHLTVPIRPSCRHCDRGDACTQPVCSPTELLRTVDHHGRRHLGHERHAGGHRARVVAAHVHHHHRRRYVTLHQRAPVLGSYSVLTS